MLLVEFSRGCASEGVCVPVASYWTMYLWGEFMYRWRVTGRCTSGGSLCTGGELLDDVPLGGVCVPLAEL